MDLEAFKDKLEGQGAKLAGPLFELFRLNHHCADQIKELNEIFAPLKRRTIEEWKNINHKEHTFKKAESWILELESLVPELEEASAEDARAMFRLLKRNITAGAHFETPLNELFAPLKQRNLNERAHLVDLRAVFAKIDRESRSHASTTPVQPTKRAIKGSTVAPKRKRPNDAQSG